MCMHQGEEDSNATAEFFPGSSPLNFIATDLLGSLAKKLEEPARSGHGGLLLQANTSSANFEGKRSMSTGSYHTRYPPNH